MPQTPKIETPKIETPKLAPRRRAPLVALVPALALLIAGGALLARDGIATLGALPAPAEAETPAQAAVQADAATPAGLALPAALDTLETRIDRAELLRTLSILAHDSMEGRQTGTEGGERARRFLLLAFDERELAPVAGTRSQEFSFTPRGRDITLSGLNVMGMVEGRVHPEHYIIVTAHYDHLGVRGDDIFNGADDNASGTAAILHLAEWFRENPPRHSIIFAALDAEEMGLQGARAFVDHPPVPLERLVMNVNLDMISRSEVGELYAAGTYHYPFLTPLVEEVARDARITLLMGHDSPDLPPGDDWTMASDHGPFHQRGIPFIYFGNEDHPGYHHPSDTFENITPGFYHGAVETILDFILVADREGERILAAREGTGG